MRLKHDDPRAAELGRAVRTGDLAALQALVSTHQGIAAAVIEDRKGGARTPLHIVTDWPGYFPNGPAMVAALLSAGADPNVIIGAGQTETPLHWAASSDDVDVAAALIAGGANLETLGASIAGGTPLDNAVGYGCWHVARLLVDRGARVDKLWHAAALGLMSRVVEFCRPPSVPTTNELNDAFWQACHGGQRRVAEYLVTRGADVHWIPDYAKQSAVEIAGSADTSRDALVTWLRGQQPRSATTFD